MVDIDLISSDSFYCLCLIFLSYCIVFHSCVDIVFFSLCVVCYDCSSFSVLCSWPVVFVFSVLSTFVFISFYGFGSGFFCVKFSPLGSTAGSRSEHATAYPDKKYSKKIFQNPSRLK